MLPRAIPLTVIALGLSAAGCSQDDGPGCPILWQVWLAGGTVGSDDGALTLDATPSSAWPGGVTVSQPGLAGDFAISVPVESFAPSDRSGQVSITLEDLDGGIRLTGAATGERIEVVYQPPEGDVVTQLLPLPHAPPTGVVLLTRHATTSTVTVVAGGESLTQSGELGTGQLVLRLTAIRPDPGIDGGSTSVRIGSVSATDDGGSFQSGLFNCLAIAE